jgi:hypothetical protein
MKAGITTENSGHTHTISKPGTGFTDPASDGHIHGLVKGCQTCAKIRAALGVQLVPTTLVNGHIHFLSTDSFNVR